MELNIARAQYIFQATVAISRGEIDLSKVPNWCSECGCAAEGGWFEGHLTVKDPQGKVRVIVGCEGYWTVNPALVGMPNPDWEDGYALGAGAGHVLDSLE